MRSGSLVELKDAKEWVQVVLQTQPRKYTSTNRLCVLCWASQSSIHIYFSVSDPNNFNPHIFVWGSCFWSSASASASLSFVTRHHTQLWSARTALQITLQLRRPPRQSTRWMQPLRCKLQLKITKPIGTAQPIISLTVLKVHFTMAGAKRTQNRHSRTRRTDAVPPIDAGSRFVQENRGCRKKILTGGRVRGLRTSPRRVIMSCCGDCCDDALLWWHCLLWWCMVSCDDVLLWWCTVVMMYCCGDVLLWWCIVVVVMMCCCDDVLLWWCIVVTFPLSVSGSLD